MYNLNHGSPSVQNVVTLCLFMQVVRSHRSGPLDVGGGVPTRRMSKWQCPLSLFLQYPCRFQDCLMSHVEIKELPMSHH